jgi:uncharacterized repeat protein (TIGR03837 family)
MLWDIFCKVIDNHGDIGVCWRLSVQLADRGEEVRLWVDDASALAWMAPQGHPRVRVSGWEGSTLIEPGDAVIEAFGCDLALRFQAAIAAKAQVRGRQPAWINLEYLTAESFAERSHGLPSPVLSGPAVGLTKHFFYPGFTPRTGGLLREPDLEKRQAAFDRARWLHEHGIDLVEGARLVSLFCYEPPALDQLLGQWTAGPGHTHVLATAGRAAAALRAALAKTPGSPLLSVTWLPLLSQPDFDQLMWACDLNFVRGEDSLVRALWADKPLVWQIYPQDDDAHHAKLSAFLDWLGAPPDLRQFHHAWNGMTAQLPPTDPQAWAACVQHSRARLQAQEDLATQLMSFAQAVPL